MSPRWIMLGLALVLTVGGCIGEDDETANSPGQITRPGDLGLPLDNPVSVAAFDVADRFLVNWFLLEDYERALQKVHPNVRESWRPLIEETEVQRTCSLLQVEGSKPDAAGTVTARYALGGCKVTAPGGVTAVYVKLTLTAADDGPWVNQVELLR